MPNKVFPVNLVFRIRSDARHLLWGGKHPPNLPVRRYVRLCEATLGPRLMPGRPLSRKRLVSKLFPDWKNMCLAF